MNSWDLRFQWGSERGEDRAPRQSRIAGQVEWTRNEHKMCDPCDLWVRSNELRQSVEIFMVSLDVSCTTLRNRATREIATHDDNPRDEAVLDAIIEHFLKTEKCPWMIKPHVRQKEEVDIRQLFSNSTSVLVLHKVRLDQPLGSTCQYIRLQGELSILSPGSRCDHISTGRFPDLRRAAVR